MHIIARDLQGLLYLMTRALSRNGLHIHSAKVATWNARAENNFYVTDSDGRADPGRRIREQWRKQILKSLSGQGCGELSRPVRRVSLESPRGTWE